MCDAALCARHVPLQGAVPTKGPTTSDRPLPLHYTKKPKWRDDQAELAWVAWLNTKKVYL